MVILNSTKHCLLLQTSYSALCIKSKGEHWRRKKERKKEYRKSSEGCLKSIVRINNENGVKGISLHKENMIMQVPNGTGTDVRRNKRPLSACHTRRNCFMETFHNSIESSLKRSRIVTCIKYYSWRVVIVFDQASACHLAFVREEPYIIGLLISVFHIGLVIASRYVVLAWGEADNLLGWYEYPDSENVLKSSGIIRVNVARWIL